MSTKPLLLCVIVGLAVLLPTRALAQAESSRLTLVPDLVTGRLLTAGEDDRYESEHRSIFTTRPGRIVVNTFVGTLSGVVTYVVVAGGLSLGFCADPRNGGYCVLPGLLLGIPAMPFGMAAGVNWVGDALDGNGGYWPAFGGAVAGLLVGGLISTSIPQTSASAFAAAAAIFGLVPGLGAAIGYELSSDRSATAAASMSISPILLPDGGGGLAFSGAF